MNELCEKVEYLTLRSRVARELSIALPGTDYEKRLVGRAVFLAVYAFLDLAPRLQNELYKAGVITSVERDTIKDKIAALRALYESQIKDVRHSLIAHRQELDLPDLFDSWNSVSRSALEEADTALREIAELLLQKNGGVDWSSLDDFDAATDAKPLAGPKSQTGVVTVAHDALALTRPQTVGLLPTHPDQEKGSRLNSVCHLLRETARMICASENSNRFVIETLWALFILTGTSLLEDLYSDRTDDESLLSRWKLADYKGLPILEDGSTKRDVALEENVRQVRNHFAAHLDSTSSLDSTLEEFGALDHVAVSRYFFHHGSIFLNSCRADIHTQMFSGFEMEVKGFTDVKSSFAKPFEKK